jgi:nicotinate-nucleotide adenylyltransferase
MSRFGILGGTFDPIHNGHLYIAENAKLFCNLDKVIFMPSAKSPHKLDKKVTDSIHRYKMCKMATEQEASFIVSDYEINKQEVSYTYNTLIEFQNKYKDVELYFILGADMLKDFPNWYKADELIKKFNIIAIARPGYNLNEIVGNSFYEEYSDKITLIDLIPVSLAASDIRRQFYRGLSIKYLVADSVYDYISDKNLYIEDL